MLTVLPLHYFIDPVLWRVTAGEGGNHFGDPHIFGPPGSVSQRSGSGSFFFLIKVLSGLK